MAETRYRRLASFAIAALLVVSVFFAAGCQRKVISEKSYSSMQFPEYSHLPRADQSQAAKEPGLFEKAGDGIGSGFKKLFKTIGKLNPFGD